MGKGGSKYVSDPLLPLLPPEYDRFLTTLLPNVTSSRLTFYFRSSFRSVNTACFTSLHLHTVLLSGMIIYLNGVEMSRQMMSPGPVTNATLVGRRTRGVGGFHF